MRPLLLNPSRHPGQARLAPRATADPYPRRARRESLAPCGPPWALLSTMHPAHPAPESATCPVGASPLSGQSTEANSKALRQIGSVQPRLAGGPTGPLRSLIR